MGVGQCFKIKKYEKVCPSSWQGGRGVASGCEGTSLTPVAEMEELKRGPQNSGRAELVATVSMRKEMCLSMTDGVTLGSVNEMVGMEADNRARLFQFSPQQVRGFCLLESPGPGC